MNDLKLLLWQLRQTGRQTDSCRVKKFSSHSTHGEMKYKQKVIIDPICLQKVAAQQLTEQANMRKQINTFSLAHCLHNHFTFEKQFANLTLLEYVCMYVLTSYLFLSLINRHSTFVTHTMIHPLKTFCDTLKNWCSNTEQLSL